MNPIVKSSKTKKERGKSQMPVENAKSRKNLRSSNNGREGGSKLSHSLSRANAAAGWSGSTTVG